MAPTVLQENLQEISANPSGRTGALISVHGTERDLGAWHCQRGQTGHGDRRVLLILEGRSEGAPEQILPLEPVSPSPPSLLIAAPVGQQGRGRAAAGQSKGRPRPGQ